VVLELVTISQFHANIALYSYMSAAEVLPRLVIANVKKVHPSFILKGKNWKPGDL
jgi:hypothetical protein